MFFFFFPDSLAFNHNVMFSNELNEFLRPSLSLTSNIYCWRCLWAAGEGSGLAEGWRSAELHSAHWPKRQNAGSAQPSLEGPSV